MQRMPEQIEELRDLVSDNDRQQPGSIRSLANPQTFRDWLANEERLVQSGERGKALDGLDRGQAPGSGADHD